ncbi:MAG: DUF4271 domain-containing protein [Bacteroidetes bacterium]|nr:DUF4271 domain-containing protein [Bacteroidota bacterium]
MLDSLNTKKKKEKRQERKSKKKEKLKEEKKTSKKNHSEPQTKADDSLQTKSVIKVAEPTKPDSLASFNLFKNHELQPKSTKPSIHYFNNITWLGWILILCYALFILVRKNYRKRLTGLLESFLSNRNTEGATRKDNPIANRLTIVLSVLFLTLMSLFCLQVNTNFHFFDSYIGLTPHNYFRIFTFVFIFYAIKIAVISLIGNTFSATAQTNHHISSVVLYNSILTFFIFPIIAIIQFTPFVSSDKLFVTSFFLLLLFNAYKLFRMFESGFSQLRVGKFYLFLYLCTLEILPLVVLIKLLIS